MNAKEINIFHWYGIILYLLNYCLLFLVKIYDLLFEESI